MSSNEGDIPLTHDVQSENFRLDVLPEPRGDGDAKCLPPSAQVTVTPAQIGIIFAD